jgi:hypothetical protein
MMKTYKKLPIPVKSAWDKKSYDPILWLYKKLGRPAHLDGMFDIYFIPKEFFINLFGYIKNVIRWTPTLWKDRDWDGHFIYEILKKKLEFQRNELVNSNRHTKVWQQNRDITICLNIIERAQRDFYELEYMDYTENRHWFQLTDLKDENGEALYSVESTNVVDNLTAYLQKYRLDVNQVLKNSNKNFDGYEKDYKTKERLCLYVSSYRAQKARKVLFGILSERLEWWWD